VAPMGVVARLHHGEAGGRLETTQGGSGGAILITLTSVRALPPSRRPDAGGPDSRRLGGCRCPDLRRRGPARPGVVRAASGRRSSMWCLPTPARRSRSACGRRARSPATSTVVDAGEDRTLTLPEDELELEGDVDDPDSKPTIAWSQVGGPSGAIFDDPSAPDSRVEFPGAGIYVLRLTADDGVNASVSDEVTITVLRENHSPMLQRPIPARRSDRPADLHHAELVLQRSRRRRLLALRRPSGHELRSQQDPEGREGAETPTRDISDLAEDQLYYWYVTAKDTAGGHPRPRLVLPHRSALRPGISVTPDRIAFGSTALGDTAEQEIAIENPGCAPLEVVAVDTTLPFERRRMCVRGRAGEPPRGALRFTPASFGPQTGTVTVESNAGSVTIPVEGEGALDLGVSPGSLLSDDPPRSPRPEGRLMWPRSPRKATPAAGPSPGTRSCSPPGCPKGRREQIRGPSSAASPCTPTLDHARSGGRGRHRARAGCPAGHARCAAVRRPSRREWSARRRGLPLLVTIDLSMPCGEAPATAAAEIPGRAGPWRRARRHRHRVRDRARPSIRSTADRSRGGRVPLGSPDGVRSRRRQVQGRGPGRAERGPPVRDPPGHLQGSRVDPGGPSGLQRADHPRSRSRTARRG